MSRLQMLVSEASLLLQKESAFVSPATLKGNIYDVESKKQILGKFAVLVFLNFKTNNKKEVFPFY